MSFRSNTLFFSLFLFLSGSFFAQDVIKVGPVYSDHISSKAFSLSKDTQVYISGMITDYEDNQSYFGWIIDSKTRKMVWSTRKADRNKEFKGIYKISDKIELKRGDYEVYYTGFENYNNFNSVGDFFSEIFGSGKRKSVRKYADKLYLEIKVYGDAQVLQLSDMAEKITKNAIVSINRTGDDAGIKKSFSLKKDMKVRVYAIGEGSSNESFDYGWLYNNDKNRKEWVFEAKNSDYAGGARKNIKADEVITLSAGNYTLHYYTDDSHSYDEWNEIPPTDPLLYGITIWPVNENELNYASEAAPNKLTSPVIEIIKVRDDELISRGFKVKKKMDIKILCLGEKGFSQDLVDYGWIIDADTREIVWEMRDRNSEDAGGAKKNRMVDDVFTISEGNYIVYYQTDDSHNYGDWNDNRPFDPERWGITIWTVNQDDKKFVEVFDPEKFKSKNVIAEITKVRDDKYITKTFEIEKETKVRIVAIGEGSRSSMSDYGWIDDASTGKNIWEMTYRKTDPAGGASKNRYVNDVIYLQKGKYKLCYRTDDSHSYNDWNEDPPKNPEQYGITLYYEK